MSGPGIHSMTLNKFHTSGTGRQFVKSQPLNPTKLFQLIKHEKILGQFIHIKAIPEMIVDYLWEIQLFVDQFQQEKDNYWFRQSKNQILLRENIIFSIPAKPVMSFGADVGNAGMFFCNACGNLRMYNWANLKMFTCGSCKIIDAPFNQNCMFSFDLGTLIKTGLKTFNRHKFKELLQYLEWATSIDKNSVNQCIESASRIPIFFQGHFSNILHVLTNNVYQAPVNGYRYTFCDSVVFTLSENIKKLLQ